MNRRIVAFLVGSFWVLTALAVGKVCWQHFYCEEPWSVVSPFTVPKCRPVSEMIEIQREYERMAKEDPYCEQD